MTDRRRYQREVERLLEQIPAAAPRATAPRTMRRIHMIFSLPFFERTDGRDRSSTPAPEVWEKARQTP